MSYKSYMSYRMFAVCELYFIAYLHTFSRGELYGLQIELTRDLFDVCKTTTRTEVNGLHCLRINID